VGGVWAQDYGNYASLLAIPVAILTISQLANNSIPVRYSIQLLRIS